VLRSVAKANFDFVVLRDAAECAGSNHRDRPVKGIPRGYGARNGDT